MNLTPLQDFVADIVMPLCWMHRDAAMLDAHQGTYGGRRSYQAVRTIPNPVSVRGSSREHGGQSPPYAIVSGWKCDSDDPSPVQQAQGCVFPHGLR